MTINLNVDGQTMSMVILDRVSGNLLMNGAGRTMNDGSTCHSGWSGYYSLRRRGKHTNRGCVGARNRTRGFKRGAGGDSSTLDYVRTCRLCSWSWSTSLWSYPGTYGEKAGIDLASDSEDNGDTTNTIQVQQMLENVGLEESWYEVIHATGQFYARETPVEDGHDAYPGLCTIPGPLQQGATK
jgi:hypothetical protein